MKITQISVYEVMIPTKGGGYRRATGFAPDANSTFIVKMDTDEGVSGFGEACTMGSHYQPGLPEGSRFGITAVGKHLLGQDPFHFERLNRLMDLKCLGDNYLKSPLDMALWDIMGKATGRPVSDLLGGRYEGKNICYRSVHVQKQHDTTDEAFAERIEHYRSQGYKYFQIKVGTDPDVDIARLRVAAEVVKPDEQIIADANCGWTYHSAIKVLNAVKDLKAPIIIEQPCATMQECINFRKLCVLPVKLDELIDSTTNTIIAAQAGAMDIACIKMARVGGLTKAKRILDLCIDMGIAVLPEDSWGSDILTAAISHLAQSTHRKYFYCTTDLTDYIELTTADGCPKVQDGYLEATTEPGLGVKPRMDVLGDPIDVITA
jgi:L-alanine-DL-glutamate epimerase-like enolase superfamily enzyme